MRSSSAAVPPLPAVVPVPAEGCYFAPSATKPGVYYRVDASTGCTCPAGQHGNVCRHLRAAYEYAGRQNAKALPPACCRGVGCGDCNWTGTREGFDQRWATHDAIVYGRTR